MNGICVTNDCQIWNDFQNTTCKQCAVVQFFSSGNFVNSVGYTFDLVNGACYIKYCKNDPR